MSIIYENDNINNIEFMIKMQPIEDSLIRKSDLIQYILDRKKYIFSISIHKLVDEDDTIEDSLIKCITIMGTNKEVTENFINEILPNDKTTGTWIYMIDFALTIMKQNDEMPHEDNYIINVFEHYVEDTTEYMDTDEE